MVIPLLLLAVMKGFDLFQGGGYRYLFALSAESGMFWLENLLAIILPLALILFFDASEKPRLLIPVAFMMAGGFILNRINVAITAMDATVRAGYFPTVWEVIVSVGVVTTGCVIFGLAVKYLPIYENEPLIERWARPIYVWPRRPDRASVPVK